MSTRKKIFVFFWMAMILAAALYGLVFVLALAAAFIAWDYYPIQVLVQNNLTVLRVVLVIGIVLAAIGVNSRAARELLERE